MTAKAQACAAEIDDGVKATEQASSPLFGECFDGEPRTGSRIWVRDLCPVEWILWLCVRLHLLSDILIWIHNCRSFGWAVKRWVNCICGISRIFRGVGSFVFLFLVLMRRLMSFRKSKEQKATIFRVLCSLAVFIVQALPVSLPFVTIPFKFLGYDFGAMDRTKMDSCRLSWSSCCFSTLRNKE